MGKKLGEFFVRADLREKDSHVWNFEEEEKKPGQPRILGTTYESLDAGDYSIVGLEDKIRIERKNGFAELFGNYSPKEHKDRFERECEKLVGIPHKFIIVETSLSNDSLSLGVPQMMYGPPAKRVLDWLVEIQFKYNIPTIFAGDSGKYVAKSIFRQIARMYL